MMMLSPFAGIPGFQFVAADQLALVVPVQVDWAASGMVIGKTKLKRLRR
jgi:chitinase